MEEVLVTKIFRILEQMFRNVQGKFSFVNSEVW